jgi:hypothetical protein
MHNEARFSVVSKIGSKYLTVPATSVPTERIFSTASFLVWKIHDNRLSADTVDKIFFLNKNSFLKFIKKQLQLFFRYIHVHVFRWIKELKMPRVCIFVEINIVSS